MINIIVACDQNRLIGKNGKLPWNIREDWEYFLKTTQKGTLIMGRHCYNDFEEHAQDRSVITLSRNQKIRFPYAQKAGSLKESLSIAKELNQVVWICGGREIYEEALGIADYLYLTEIKAEYSGNVYLPPWEKYFTREISRKSIQTDSAELIFRVLTK
ncbi:MAG: dihydrofolate reductase [Opitutae bacterium]|jgi:dihydrofolate reductase|nr:dihydrofolate reductase [Opitutae bacterium]